MSHARRLSMLLSAMLLLLLLSAATAFARPTHLLVVVMDQMRPEYAQQYDMTHVLWLEQNGVFFPNAYVGDMASETVVSHNVIASGRFPGHMGWSDEAFRDVDDLFTNPESGEIIETGALSYAQYSALIEAAGDYPKIGTYLHAAFPGSIVAYVGEKGYQVQSMAAGKDNANFWVFMGGKKNVVVNADGTHTPDVPWTGKYRYPDGKLPSSIKDDSRFLISSGNSGDKYGTADFPGSWPSYLYPEDGRYVPGPYPGHESGDIWVADAARAILQQSKDEGKDWSGLFINFGGIDKIGHMWGGGDVDDLQHYTWDPNSNFNWVHLPFQAKNADEQLGRVLDWLDDNGQLDDTLVVLLADHGSQSATKGYYGNKVADGGNASWYAGSWYPNWNTPSDPTSPANFQLGPAALKPLMDTGNVQFSYQSTAIETWLKDFSMPAKAAAAKVMGTLPGVIATYVKNNAGTSYLLQSSHTSTAMTDAERAWWVQRGQQLVNAMAWKGSADVVGLLADNVSYGVFGDHGGAQKQVQRIPMAFYSADLAGGADNARIRLVDVMPTILKTMGIVPVAAMDGKAYSLPAAD